MPSFWIENKDTDVILHNKYGIYSKKELLSQLQEGFLTIDELGQIYKLREFQINNVIHALGISYRNNLNDIRVLTSSITPTMHQVFIGTLLGDAYMRESRSFQTAHSINQLDYFYTIAEKLGDFVSSVKYTNVKFGESVGFWTHNHSVFEQYFDRFYSHGKQKKFFKESTVPDLEAEGLAYWYMDDGKYGEYGAILCTGDATVAEIDMLREVLKNRFNIESNTQAHDIKKGYYYIYIKAESRSHFFEIIDPYIISSMRYKLDGSSYPRNYTKKDIVERHLSYCDAVKRPVRFSGDDELQDSIENNYRVSDPKREYIKKIQDTISKGELISHTDHRKMPTENELKEMLEKGMTDESIGRMRGFGRNTISDMRRSLGIPIKYHRESKKYEATVKFPCMSVKLVPSIMVKSNDYNPNVVCEPEMKLLVQSIEKDGLTQPVVVYFDSEKQIYIVVDGFHRYKILTDHFKCTRIPVVVIDKDINDRMSSTIRHNRARGRHQVDLTGELLDKMQKQGWSDDKIAENLGMEGEELLRLRQQIGCAKFLSGQEYSNSWEMIK